MKIRNINPESASECFRLWVKKSCTKEHRILFINFLKSLIYFMYMSYFYKNKCKIIFKSYQHIDDKLNPENQLNYLEMECNEK